MKRIVFISYLEYIVVCLGNFVEVVGKVYVVQKNIGFTFLDYYFF